MSSRNPNGSTDWFIRIGRREIGPTPGLIISGAAMAKVNKEKRMDCKVKRFITKAEVFHEPME